MTISDIIHYLKHNLDKTDIKLNPGASARSLEKFEKTGGITLPNDVKQFYLFSEGFHSMEDDFNIVPIEQLEFYFKREKRLYLAEYMVYCDMWELRIDPKNANNYSIVYGDLILTNSFAEFLQRFLDGGVFERGGLYDWRDEIKAINKPCE